MDWVAQYLPDKEHFFDGLLFFGAFATLPAIVTFVLVKISKWPFFLPGIFATTTALIMLAYWHHDNDLTSDAQAALTLVFIPIYTAGYAVVAGVLGLLIQWLLGFKNREN